MRVLLVLSKSQRAHIFECMVSAVTVTTSRRMSSIYRSDVIALLIFFAVSFVGPWVSERLLDAAAPLHGCPPPFTLTMDRAHMPPGVDRDLNGDGWLCMQEVPGNGNGKGNTGHTYNVKDNNRLGP